VAVQDGTDGAAFDAELFAEFVDGGPGLVGGDEVLDLLVGELACPLRWSRPGGF